MNFIWSNICCISIIYISWRSNFMGYIFRGPFIRTICGLHGHLRIQRTHRQNGEESTTA